MLGLPAQVRACLFDLDGVLTQTATVHAQAWKETFDRFLAEEAAPGTETFVPFDQVADYDKFVDGRRRADGVRAFLASRRITVPEGRPDDPADARTVHGLANRKNRLLLELLRREGVKAYDGSVRYVEGAREAGLGRAVVSASENCRDVLKAAGIECLFDVRVDGIVAKREGLRGKPAPDTYLAAARRLDVAPVEAAVFEDALAGVSAGRAGCFGLVVGVDRAGQANALRDHGADIVVSDLADLLAAG